MATEQERRLKAEHDAWLARSQAAANQANLEYIAMMDDIDLMEDEQEGMADVE